MVEVPRTDLAFDLDRYWSFIFWRSRDGEVESLNETFIFLFSNINRNKMSYFCFDFFANFLGFWFKRKGVHDPLTLTWNDWALRSTIKKNHGKLYGRDMAIFHLLSESF